MTNGNIDPERVRKTTYLHEFDREIQGPTWGYPTEGAYYRDASSVDSILNIRIPVFAINAEDDPVRRDHDADFLPLIPSLNRIFSMLTGSSDCGA